MKFIVDMLRDPILNGVDVDCKERLYLHKKMLEKKHMLREVFNEFHDLFRKLEQIYLCRSGLEVEIGAGVSPMRSSYPNVLATDIVDAPTLDLIINAEAMNFEDSSIKVIYGQNCFHHFPHPDKFLHELERVLLPGGGAILLEPYYGPFAHFMYKRLFRTEGFDINQKTWETPIIGPMNGANQALSYIVFIRDRSLFLQMYPSLQIVHQETVGNYLKYLISGGLNFRQLLPDSFTGLINVLEKAISPLNRWIALHHVIVIRKINPQ